MKIRTVVICMALLLPFVAPLDAGVWDSITGYFSSSQKNTPPTIKTLLVQDKVGVVLEVKGKYKIVDPHTGNHLGTRFDGKENSSRL